MDRGFLRTGLTCDSLLDIQTAAEAGAFTKLRILDLVFCLQHFARMSSGIQLDNSPNICCSRPSFLPRDLSILEAQRMFGRLTKVKIIKSSTEAHLRGRGDRIMIFDANYTQLDYNHDEIKSKSYFLRRALIPISLPL